MDAGRKVAIRDSVFKLHSGQAARAALAVGSQRAFSQQRPAHWRSAVKARGFDNHLRALQRNKTSKEQNLQFAVGSGWRGRREQRLLGADVHDIHFRRIDSQGLGKKTRVLRGIGQHPVGAGEQPAFITQQPAGAQAVNRKVVLLVDLLVIGAGERVDE